MGVSLETQSACYVMLCLPSCGIFFCLTFQYHNVLQKAQMRYRLLYCIVMFYFDLNIFLTQI